MKTLVIVALLLYGCSTIDTKIRATVEVPVTEAGVPASGAVNQSIKIPVKAEASNGCYSNLQFKFEKQDPLHYLIKAQASYESNGVCAAHVVLKDTVINFTPSTTGKHFFQINQAPLLVKFDTLVVN